MRLLRVLRLSLLGSALLAILCSSEAAAEKQLTKEEDALWRQAVLDVKTADGSTVGELLEFVAKMRPQVFKVQEVRVGYALGGIPGVSTVCYWIGQERLDGDAYCDISFKMAVSGSQVNAAINNELFAEQAVKLGRYAFLKFIDDAYQLHCIDPGSGKHMC